MDSNSIGLWLMPTVADPDHGLQATSGHGIRMGNWVVRTWPATVSHVLCNRRAAEANAKGIQIPRWRTRFHAQKRQRAHQADPPCARRVAVRWIPIRCADVGSAPRLLPPFAHSVITCCAIIKLPYHGMLECIGIKYAPLTAGLPSLSQAVSIRNVHSALRKHA